MSNTNKSAEGSEASKHEPVIIDIEQIFILEQDQPVHDPGIVILYRIKVDQEYHDVHHSHLLGKEILALAGKSSEHYFLKQSARKDGQKELIVVEPEERVSFKEPGIEKFITERREYVFFVKKVKDIEYKTIHPQLKVRQILKDFAEVDPEKNTLAEKQNGSVHEFKNLDEELDLRQVRHFIVFSDRPTTVS